MIQNLISELGKTYFRCSKLLACWNQLGGDLYPPLDQLMLGPNLLKDLEQLVTKVEVNLKEAQDCRKVTRIGKEKIRTFK